LDRGGFWSLLPLGYADKDALALFQINELLLSSPPPSQRAVISLSVRNYDFSICERHCRHVREPPRYQMRVASVRMYPLIKAVPMTDLPGVDHVSRIGGILTLARVAWRLDDTDTIKIIR
jgi:hypothetical protein